MTPPVTTLGDRWRQWWHVDIQGHVLDSEHKPSGSWWRFCSCGTYWRTDWRKTSKEQRL